MTTFKHKDIDIALAANGEFSAAMPDGKHITAPSMAAMKKKIDKALTTAFEPFEALVPAYSGGFDKVTVARIDLQARNRRYGIAARVFIIGGATGYNKERYVVIRNTPENCEAVAAYVKRKKEISNEMEALRDEERKLERSLPWIKPSDVDGGK